jgi:hypothetical protein
MHRGRVQQISGGIQPHVPSSRIASVSVYIQQRFLEHV